MSQLVLASSVSAYIAQLKKKLPQSLLLHGSSGVGLGSIASEIAGASAITIAPLSAKGEADHGHGTISIERIRQLYQQTHSKQHSQQVIIIDDADRMSHGAQNAFLKLLEEPIANIHFILTTHRPDKLLATVRSRTTDCYIPPISEAQSREIVVGYKMSQSERSKALFIGAGRPAELHRLCQDPARLEALSLVMSDARSYLADKSRYKRLTVGLRHSTTMQSAVGLVDACIAIISHTLYTAPSSDTARMAEDLMDIQNNLLERASPRLQLTRFVLK